MVMPFSIQEVVPTYKEYKAKKFEKYKRKVEMLLRGICQTSLKGNDKVKLLIELKTIVANFQTPL